MNKSICKTYPSGSKYWRLNGKYHREDGPAIECSDGDYKLWYLWGKSLTEEEHHREILIMKLAGIK